MALPMMKDEKGEGRRFLAERLARRPADAPELTPELIARAEELERELGRPLRVEYDGPVSDAESEEILIGRMTDDCEWIPLDELLAKYDRA